MTTIGEKQKVLNGRGIVGRWNEMKPVHLRKVQQHWRGITDKLSKEGKLKGHRFSDKPYTLYSMRSTFIEDHLLKGTDLFLLARIAGHAAKELMQSYERLDIRSRAKEITDIQYGKKKSEANTVNLLTSQTRQNLFKK